MLARVEHAGVAKQLEPGAVRVVHHEEGDPIGGIEVARADKLAVAFEIREADKVRSQHLYESRRTSAVLHVGPARLAYGRHVEAVARGNEVSFVTRERVGLGCVLHDLVLSEIFVLGLLHSGRERELHEFVSHSVYFSRSDFARSCAWFSDPMGQNFGIFLESLSRPFSHYDGRSKSPESRPRFPPHEFPERNAPYRRRPPSQKDCPGDTPRLREEERTDRSVPIQRVSEDDACGSTPETSGKEPRCFCNRLVDRVESRYSAADPATPDPAPSLPELCADQRL